MQGEYLELATPEMAVDLRWARLPDDLIARHAARIARAEEDRITLEGGAIANPDEGRQVGHYWLRAPKLAPTVGHTKAILRVQGMVARFVAALDGRFDTVIAVGIGGSALGPQLLIDALAGHGRRVVFVDNTDPDGIARTVAPIALDAALVIVTSKSGGTVETRNAARLIAEAYAQAGLDFAAHAVAITGAGSRLDAMAQGWLARFPMWDWVGGRTSVTSAVGLLPMALAGIDTEGFLAGAAAMDAACRSTSPADNPAMMLALSWWEAADQGRAARAMVVLPYKDRLALLARYLQQLVMESLGKRLDRAGRVVHQGLTVYGNKGSTDQHAYVQQLREGPDDSFIVFVEVLEDGGSACVMEDGVRAGDHLSGFLAGTRAALADAGRRSVTLTLQRVTPPHLGALIALFERAVSFYASFADINAYHQPGVEAGKVAATAVVGLQAQLVAALDAGGRGDAHTLAEPLGADPRLAFHILRHLAANGRCHASGAGLSRVFSKQS